MPRYLKLIGSTAGGLGVLLVIGVLALPALLNAAVTKRYLQARTAAAADLELGIGGRLEMSLFPGLQLTLNDLHFGREGIDVATVEQLRIGIDVWPLLHKEVRINGITLQTPVILLERYQDGSYNVRKPEPRVTLNLARILVENGSFHFNDALTGTQYDARTCNLDLQGSRPLARDDLDHPADLAFAAEFGCAEIRKDRLTMTDVNVSATAHAGVILFEPLSLQMFGARGTGQFQADFTGAVPRYQLSYTLPRFRIDDLFRMLIPQTSVAGTLVEGAMDFSTTLSMQGQTLVEAKQTLSGALALRGDNLVLNGIDLDEKFARFESSQNFNLVDAGAFLLAGPLGLAVTKGYDFANIFRESGTRSEIRSVVSDWDIAAGVAQARYVMMATHANRIALKGGLDLPRAQFRDVTLALLDDEGCARVEQAMRGSFQHPVIDKPNVLSSLAGPFRTLIRKLVPAKKCEAFYPVEAAH